MSPHEYSPQLDDGERLSRDELRTLQLVRMKATLEHAYRNAPHYRAAFDAAGVRPGDLAELADLARFPFTTKDNLRRAYPFGSFACPREQVVRIHASSGTTGELVFTSLTKQAMPVIRYRTGDLTRLLPGTARVMRRMERITGRCDDMLIIRGVNV